jgi:hypothetical protein
MKLTQRQKIIVGIVIGLFILGVSLIIYFTTKKCTPNCTGKNCGDDDGCEGKCKDNCPGYRCKENVCTEGDPCTNGETGCYSDSSCDGKCDQPVYLNGYRCKENVCTEGDPCTNGETGCYSDSSCDGNCDQPFLPNGLKVVLTNKDNESKTVLLATSTTSWVGLVEFNESNVKSYNQIKNAMDPEDFKNIKYIWDNCMDSNEGWYIFSIELTDKAQEVKGFVYPKCLKSFDYTPISTNIIQFNLDANSFFKGNYGYACIMLNEFQDPESN